MQLICKVDKLLVIPPYMRGFPNKEEITLDLKAGIPEEVPEYVANFYVKNYPNIYASSIEEFSKISEDVPLMPPAEPEVFSPTDFLINNAHNMEIGLNGLKRMELMAVAKSLNLTGYHQQKSTEIINRIIHDLAVKERQQEEFNKHKDVIGNPGF